MFVWILRSFVIAVTLRETLSTTPHKQKNSEDIIIMPPTPNSIRPVLLGFNNNAGTKWKSVNVPSAIGKSTAVLPDFDTCLEKLGSTKSPKATELLNRMLYNKVRVCTNCNKPNGFTMSNCNACGTDISTVELSKTLNVFAGFMLSIGRSTFPLTISLRKETSTAIVIDDLLSLSPIHVNVIPTKQYIPDWRYLLRRPTEGLKVVESLVSLAQSTIQEQFILSDNNNNNNNTEEYLQQFTTINEDTNPFDISPDLSLLGMGFNYPPSQYQLHLQCIFPVMMPYQYYMFQKGTHFSQGRFFPVEYVIEALKQLVVVETTTNDPLPEYLVQDDTPIEDIVDYFSKTYGIDAEQVRLRFVKRFEQNYHKYQNWNSDNFEFVGIHDETTNQLVVDRRRRRTTVDGGGGGDDDDPSNNRCNNVADDGDDDDEKEEEEHDVMKLVTADKMTFQNYGRPYDPTTGKPTGKYYSYPASDIEKDIEFW